MEIKAIIGLGNPGRQYHFTRHNIGFRVVDELCKKYGGSWKTKEIMEVAEIVIGDKKIMLIKPQTFMNSSGKVIPILAKSGVKAENILVVHDELELPMGTIKPRMGGSARGHNGLKSIIEQCSDQFARVRFGISRPERKEDVPDYVLQNFTESQESIDQGIAQAITVIEDLVYGQAI